MWRHAGILTTLITMGCGTVAKATSPAQMVEGLEQCQSYRVTGLLMDVSDRTLCHSGAVVKAFKATVGKPG